MKEPTINLHQTFVPPGSAGEACGRGASNAGLAIESGREIPAAKAATGRLGRSSNPSIGWHRREADEENLNFAPSCKATNTRIRIPMRTARSTVIVTITVTTNTITHTSNTCTSIRTPTGRRTITPTRIQQAKMTTNTVTSVS
jgi:hypothetical protein